MSASRSFPLSRNRNRILASVAALALATAGAIGEGALRAPHSAQAADVTTSAPQHQTIPSFAPLIAHVKPAVVSVKVKIVHQDDSNNSNSQLNNLPPELRRFFRQFGQPNGSPDNPRQVIVGEGSGFFISSDGYIVTNNHVVQNSKSVTVTMDNGKVIDAKVVGTDPKTDLALLKVDEPGNYPYVTFATGEPKIGDWVLAIGNPYGLGGTVTAGIISAEGRNIGDGPYDRFLQIDAPINRGNSGGPAFNEDGQVVGVNTAIFSPSGGSVGIGFAIPADTVNQVVTALEHGGVVQRGYLGVRIQEINPDMAEALGLKSKEGAIVASTMSGTPAVDAGLQAGDVITKVNGKEVKDAGDLTRQIGAMKPGDKVQISFIRKGAEKTAEVTLAPQENETVAKAQSNAPEEPQGFGLELAPAHEIDPNQKGVAVTGVDPAGQAAQKGLAKGDVILEIDGKPVSTPGDVNSGIATAKQTGKKAVMMRVRTADGNDRFVAFAFPKVG
ncbi:MAG TPA: Do family serine endopeptidase [Roseiarcus sp.]|jgi:serine protease Do|nr:Do family serine endopeptidase [Roseiarcus sp.]